MKLFIWNNPYKVPYGQSMVFAVAETLESAKEVARNHSKAYSYGEFDCRVPNVELGDPLRVVDLPCAEWHELSE